MFRPISTFVGLRYLGARQKNRLLSFISFMAMAGLSLGVFVLIVVMSVMNGFDREMRERVLGMVPHGVLYNAYGPMEQWQSVAERALEHPNVVEVAPLVETTAMVTSRGEARGILVSGILPQAEHNVSIVDEHMQSGRLDDLQPGQYGIVLGNLLARFLGVNVGDRVVIVFPEASVTPSGVFPRMKRFTVMGTFSVGAQLDGSLAYIHLEDAAKINRIASGHVHGVRLKLDNLFVAPKVAQDLRQNLGGGFHVRDWTRVQGSLYEAIQLEKTLIGVLLMFIVAVAAFNIVAMLVMVVQDKQGDIAILRTLGVTSRTVLKIFMVQGVMIGVIGVFIGTSTGLLAAYYVAEIVAGLEQLFGFEVFPKGVYFINYFPSEILWQDVVIIVSTTLGMSLLATIYPALKASRVRPAEALRYE